MTLLKTLEQALKTKKVNVISIEEYEHKGVKRNWIKATKGNGKVVYRVAQYANGLYSKAV